MNESEQFIYDALVKEHLKFINFTNSARELDFLVTDVYLEVKAKNSAYDTRVWPFTDQSKYFVLDGLTARHMFVNSNSILLVFDFTSNRDIIYYAFSYDIWTMDRIVGIRELETKDGRIVPKEKWILKFDDFWYMHKSKFYITQLLKLFEANKQRFDYETSPYNNSINYETFGVLRTQEFVRKDKHNVG